MQLYQATATLSFFFTVATADVCGAPPCRAGCYLADITTCATVPSGHFSSEGSNTAYECPAGYYSTSGAYECTPCPRGQYSWRAASGACFDCGIGEYSDQGSTSCDQCDPTEYFGLGAYATVEISNIIYCLEPETFAPTISPTNAPTQSSMYPSQGPSSMASQVPSQSPTQLTSSAPSQSPTVLLSTAPSSSQLSTAPSLSPYKQVLYKVLSLIAAAAAVITILGLVIRKVKQKVPPPSPRVEGDDGVAEVYMDNDSDSNNNNNNNNNSNNNMEILEEGKFKYDTSSPDELHIC